MNFELPTIGMDFYIAVLPILILCGGAVTTMLQGVFASIGSQRAVLSVLMVS